MLKEGTITVFTPTYNRAYILPRLYHSLCRQTNKHFQWIVIDDGSTDNTHELIKEWEQEKYVKIFASAGRRKEYVMVGESR